MSWKLGRIFKFIKKTQYFLSVENMALGMLFKSPESMELIFMLILRFL